MLIINLRQSELEIEVNRKCRKEANKILKLGIGTPESPQKIKLRAFEALYLVYSGRAVIHKEGKILDFNEALKELSKIDEYVWPKFILVNDLLKRNYAVKKLSDREIEFLVSERRRDSPSEYIFYGVLEGKPLTFAKLRELIKKGFRMRKNIVLALIDKEGNITYYTLSYSGK